MYSPLFENNNNILQMNCLKTNSSGNTENHIWYNTVSLKKGTFLIKENTTPFGFGGAALGSGSLDAFGQYKYYDFGGRSNGVLALDWSIMIAGDTLSLETIKHIFASGLNGPWSERCLGIIKAE